MRKLRSAALAILLASSTPALARSDKTFAYPHEQAWPAAVRFLVVNEQLKVTDKDADAGYAVFEIKDDGKTYRGALEVIDAVVDGRPVVKIAISIADRPTWMEIAMLTRLEAKLREELGPQTPAPKKPTEGTHRPTDGKIETSEPG